ncbi:MAG: glycoside hydrolase family 71/99-like protein [Haliscomenobacter sp.]
MYLIARRFRRSGSLIFILWTWFSCQKNPTETVFEVVSYPAAQVVRTYKTPVYLHYMPWFESPEYAEYPERDKGNWGAHWTMANRNPQIQDAAGKRQIAAHYYPLIGPYDNGEPNYLEYAVTCMKLSGVDGVLIDFPGNTPVYDWKLLLDHTNALLPWLEKAGLRFGLVYEDKALDNAYTQGIISDRVQEARQVVQYMQTSYFSKPNYLQLDGKPVLLNFGPQAIFQDAQWNTVFSLIPDIQFVTLPYTRQNYQLHTSVDGEFAWVSETIDDNFYRNASKYPILIGGAMPGFKDFYQEGGWGAGYTDYDDEGGGLFRRTLEKAASYPIDLLQIITWNDFGEGTVVEPTREFGYARLEQIQRFVGVSYTAKDLELAVRLYQKRKELRGDSLKNLQLDQVFYYLVSLQTDKAKQLLDRL